MRLRILLIVAASFALSSCKKTYQCECEVVLNGSYYTIVGEPFKATKKNAKLRCESESYDYGWTNYQTCYVK